MEVIERISAKIEDELHDACEYAKMALEYRDTYRSLGDTLYALSQDEYRHNLMLHNEVTALIENYRRDRGEPPPEMQAVYDYLHRKAIDKAETVKRYIAMYKD